MSGSCEGKLVCQYLVLVTACAVVSLLLYWVAPQASTTALEFRSSPSTKIYSCCGDAASYDGCPITAEIAKGANAVYNRWMCNKSGGDKDRLKLQLYGRAPVAYTCPQMQAFGKAGIEAKMICNAEKVFQLEQSNDCVVISIGSANEWSFEESIFKGSKCRVETFDCTFNKDKSLQLKSKNRTPLTPWSVPAPLRSRVQLHDLCLGASRGVKGNMEKTVEGKTLNWLQVLEHAGIKGKRPHLLKIDCEGCEQELFRSLLETGMHTLLPDQILLEIHYPYDPRNTNKLRYNWNKWMAQNSKWPVEDMMKAMYTKAGFTVISHVENSWAPCCIEITLARTRCQPIAPSCTDLR